MGREERGEDLQEGGALQGDAGHHPVLLRVTVKLVPHHAGVDHPSQLAQTIFDHPIECGSQGNGPGTKSYRVQQGLHGQN